MDTFEPLINVLTLLSVLSVLAERWTNILKLRRENLRVKGLTEAEEKQRELAIAGRNVAIGIFIAVLLKADLFAILVSMDAPWKTLGWVHVENYRWMRSAASMNVWGFLYALTGCVLTGIGLGFGSKFWHDILGSVYELRDGVRKRNALIASPASSQESSDA